MPTIVMNKLFNYSGVFTDLQDGKVKIYVHDGDVATEIDLDEDSVNALHKARTEIDDLLSKELILTGTIVKKMASEVVSVMESKTQIIDVPITEKDLSDMQAEIISKPLIK